MTLREFHEDLTDFMELLDPYEDPPIVFDLRIPEDWYEQRIIEEPNIYFRKDGIEGTVIITNLIEDDQEEFDYIDNEQLVFDFEQSQNLNND